VKPGESFIALVALLSAGIVVGGLAIVVMAHA
jgi:hypothetical protein